MAKNKQYIESKIEMFLNYLLIILYISHGLCEVNTTSGLVMGTTIKVFNASIDQYLGIPYAEPPVEKLRFAKPKPITIPSKAIINATVAKYTCLQPSTNFVGHLPQSEDCLTLNIWSPKQEDSPNKLKPVMFWIYGGKLNIGSIYQQLYNGSFLATHDIVLVSVNYRLGLFGFLYGNESSAPGNVGFYDQQLALKWIRDNIHLFGGDKQQITIFGESAGSWSVSAHLLSTESKGLFRRAITQSGAFMYNRNRSVLNKEEAITAAKILAKKLNCTDDNVWLECLRKLDAKYLIDQYLIPTDVEWTFPVVGTDFLPISANSAFEQKKINADIDLMAGVLKDEGTFMAEILMPNFFTRNFTKQLFDEIFDLADPIFHNLKREDIEKFYLNNESDPSAIKWAISKFVGQLTITCPTYLFAKQYAKLVSLDTNVYFYEFTHSSMGPEYEEKYGVTHAADLEITFGQTLLKPNVTEEDMKYSKQVMKYWTNFAKYGKPDPKWPELIDRKANTTLVKDLNPKHQEKYFTDLFAKTCDGFWRNYF